jgi:hypothetical protein
MIWTKEYDPTAAVYIAPPVFAFNSNRVLHFLSMQIIRMQIIRLGATRKKEHPISVTLITSQKRYS